MATSISTGPCATWVRTPILFDQDANSCARPGLRERTHRRAPRSAAATAVARADPPLPTTRHRVPFPAPPIPASACVTPKTSVLSPTSTPSSVQNVLHAPTRAQTSVLRVTDPSTASLWGTVTLPAPPAARCAARTPANASGATRSATYTASMPSARKAALCMAGEREWATGSPMTTSRRVLALISTFAFGGQPFRHSGGEGLELLTGVAVHIEIAAERV